MEQNNGAVPQEQPTASGEQIITAYGAVSKEYVESLILNSGSTKIKKKSVGKRIFAWFFGIVGGVSFLALCVILCISALKLTGGMKPGSNGSTFDEDFFHIPGYFFGNDDETEKSETDIPIQQTSNAGLGVVVTVADSDEAQMYGIPGGVVIIGIEPNSSFIGTDVKEYDIITKADGLEITNTTRLSTVLNKHQVGDELTLTITRFTDGFAETFDVTVTLIDKNA